MSNAFVSIDELEKMFQSCQDIAYWNTGQDVLIEIRKRALELAKNSTSTEKMPEEMKQ